jgi:hypothetical protein
MANFADASGAGIVDPDIIDKAESNISFSGRPAEGAGSLLDGIGESVVLSYFR